MQWCAIDHALGVIEPAAGPGAMEMADDELAP
jgi:hypothetical protein